MCQYYFETVKIKRLTNKIPSNKTMNNTSAIVWNNCLSFIEDNITQQAYKTWFEPIVPVKLEDNILTIQVPSHFFYEWLEEHYITLLSKVIKKEIGSEGQLEYSIVMENNSNSSKMG